MDKLVDLFCHVDDFCKVFMPQWQKLQRENGERKRNQQSLMSPSEIMTIIIAFHMSPARLVFEQHHRPSARLGAGVGPEVRFALGFIAGFIQDLKRGFVTVDNRLSEQRPAYGPINRCKQFGGLYHSISQGGSLDINADTRQLFFNTV